jgi:lipopolysaccharide/colanic/teichoic acid biosynthesis glycosyltransferase
MKELSKRIFDILISLLAIAILLPVITVIAVAIKISDKGPVIFKQQRGGKNGKPFVFYKFRTMKHDVNPFGQSPKSDDDPRLISMGKFLREYSLDELPQLFNVLKGDMSLVGPRPLYISQISGLNDYHKKRLLVRPGITGLSQLYGRSELTSKKYLDLEAEYVEKQSLWLDIKIIFLTFGIVVGKKGVYEK